MFWKRVKLRGTVSYESFLTPHRAVIVELGHEFRRDHWFQAYGASDFKYLKGFAFLLHPCKAI
jgi:hypothetical protein